MVFLRIRISDLPRRQAGFGSEGWGFESSRDHNSEFIYNEMVFLRIRISDLPRRQAGFGSEGCRFESCRGHE
jgi:hypothetical protein